MAIFCECTTSLRRYHQFRASIAQDIDESHDHHIRWACGGAGPRRLINNTIKDRVSNQRLFDRLDLLHPELAEDLPSEEASRLINLSYRACFNRVSEFCIRSLPAVLLHPHIAVSLLAPENYIRDQVVVDLRSFWMKLLKAEDRSHWDPVVNAQLSLLHWRSHPLPRLLPTLIEHNRYQDASDVALRILFRWPDEKIVEDIHNHVKATSRSQRHKIPKISTMYRAGIESKCIEARNVPQPSVSIDEVARKMDWRSSDQQHVREYQSSSHQECWNRDWSRDLMQEHLQWPAPSTKGLAESWLVQEATNWDHVDGRSWIARLVPEQQTLIDPQGYPSWVVYRGLFGIIAWPLIPVADRSSDIPKWRICTNVHDIAEVLKFPESAIHWKAPPPKLKTPLWGRSL